MKNSPAHAYTVPAEYSPKIVEISLTRSNMATTEKKHSTETCKSCVKRPTEKGSKYCTSCLQVAGVWASAVCDRILSHYSPADLIAMRKKNLAAKASNSVQGIQA